MKESSFSMADITIVSTGSERYEVTVEAGVTTTHSVTLAEAYYEKLTRGEVSPERLIQASCEFLLARESNTMILQSFDLPLIGR